MDPTREFNFSKILARVAADICFTLVSQSKWPMAFNPGVLEVKNPFLKPIRFLQEMDFGASYDPIIRFHESMVLADSGETNVYCSRHYI